MSTYWGLTAKIVDASTGTEINTGASVYYSFSSSIHTTSGYLLTPGTQKNITGDNSDDGFYFKAVIDSGYTFAKYALLCTALSSTPTEIAANPTATEWDLSSVKQTSSARRVIATVTLYITPVATTVDVEFDGNGGTAPSETKTVPIGGYYGYLPTPVRSSYAFAGWYTDATGGTQITADTIVSLSVDHKLYAHWAAASSITVAFHAMGGSGAPASITVSSGALVTIPDTVPVRSGYIFAGWAVDTYGYNVEYQPGKSYPMAASCTLYAAWRIDTQNHKYSGSLAGVNLHRILFSADDATASGLPAGVSLIPSLDGFIYCVEAAILNSGTTPDYDNPSSYLFTGTNVGGDYNACSVSGVIGSSSPVITGTKWQCLYSAYSGGSTGPAYDHIVLGVDLAALDAIGLEFAGWFVASTTASYTDPAYYNATGAMLHYGEHFTVDGFDSGVSGTATNHMIAPLVRKKRYVCAFDAQGGTVSPVFKYVTYNDAYGTLPTPTLTGYAFQGWFTEATGGTQITSSSVFTSRAHHVLYAHWSASGAIRTLYFDAAGGTVSTASIAVTVGSAYGTLPTPTRTGYTFAGWYRSTVGTDQVTAATIADDENPTVYAHWTPQTLTITFNANGGTVSETSRSVLFGNQYLTLPVPVYAGKSFAGWFTESTGGTQATASTVATASVILYAHWTDGTASWGYVRYSIYLAKNGGTLAASYGALKYVAGYAKALPTSTEIAKSGYTFAGWYTTPDFTGSPVTSIPSTARGSQTFYARWV